MSAVAVVAALAALLFGSLPTKVVACVIAAAAVQGAWLGAAATLGAFVGIAVAAVLAPSLGRMAEATVSDALGTTGLQNRMASALLAGALVLVVFGGVGCALSRRFIRPSASLRRWNRIGGATLGALEGCLLSMMLLWAPLTLESFARFRMAADEEAGRPPSPAAQRVVRYAEGVRRSVLGGVARATNPLAASPLFDLCEDFAAVARDEAAMQRFIDSPVMRDIRALSSVARAREIIEQDAALVESFRDREQITADTVRKVMESEFVLRAIDATTVVRDLTPRVGEIAEALREAKASIGDGGR